MDSSSMSGQAPSYLIKKEKENECTVKRKKVLQG